MFKKDTKNEKEPEVTVTRPVSFTVYDAQISGSVAQANGKVATIVTVPEAHAQEILVALLKALIYKGF